MIYVKVLVITIDVMSLRKWQKENFLYIPL